MQSWVLFAVTGMLSIAAAAGCATAPANPPAASPRSAKSSLAPATRPASTRPSTRPTTAPAPRAVTKRRPATRPVAAAKPKPAPAPAPAKTGPEFWTGEGKCEGIASFYAGKFIGRKTANGERYTGRKLTAAHRVLPFNTYVRVTRLDNGLSVIVRINDRGPYIDGRVIDLSPAAARKIHMIKTGITPVKLEIVAAWMAEE